MFERYKVTTEDTLDFIAKKFGTTEEYLKSINDLYFTENLREGTDLIVPISKDNYYNVEKSKYEGSIDYVSEKYNVNPRLFEYMNGLDNHDYIYMNQNILIPKSNYSYYITQAGDTIKSVAEIFNISKDRLYNQNQVIYLLDNQIIVNKKIGK